MFKAILMVGVLSMTVSTAVADSSRWKVGETVDPLDDSVSLYASTGITSKVGIGVVCNGEKIVFFAQTQNFDFGMGSHRDVVWRTDNDETRQERWERGSSGGAYAFDEHAVEIAREIRDAGTRFVIDIDGKTQVFGVSGSTAAINRVFDHCDIE